MSYISTADAAAISSARSAQSVRQPAPARLRGAVPVGPTLEVALFVATSFAVSLVFCTTVAGALLH